MIDFVPSREQSFDKIALLSNREILYGSPSDLITKSSPLTSLRVNGLPAAECGNVNLASEVAPASDSRIFFVIPAVE
jgi:hypothetical protein